MIKIKIKRKSKPTEEILTSDDLIQKGIDDVNFLNRQYISKRNIERGSVESQLEFIVENGINAFINRDLAIRLKHPKTEA